MKTLPSILQVPLVIAAGLLISSLPAAAQSAEGFDTSDLAPVEPAPAAAAPAKASPTPAPANIEIVPSRYAGDEIAAYVSTLLPRLSITKRETDPFGRYQDPERKVPEPKILQGSPNRQQFKIEPPTPFVDIIAMLSVKLVDASKQQFLIEDRIFRVKEVVTLALQNGKQVKAQIMAVSVSRISFRNVETGESATLNLDLLPANMQRGNGGITVPGVHPTGGDAPIQIQPAVPLSTNP